MQDSNERFTITDKEIYNKLIEDLDKEIDDKYDIRCLSLRELVNEDTTPERRKEIKDAFSTFTCPDKETENFIRNEVINTKIVSLQEIAFLLNEHDFKNGKINILAYFSISQHIMECNNNGKEEYIPFVSIDHIGKNTGYVNDNDMADIEINLKDILYYIIKTISWRQFTRCNFIIIELEDNEKLAKMFEKCGFVFLQKKNGVSQYYLKKSLFQKFPLM